ncbi:MAG: pyridoxal phosphate-dependent decarboxylase family protein [Longimicrobiales bacterium]
MDDIGTAVEAEPRTSEITLDPEDWESLRALGHRMVDDVIAFHSTIADRPAWRPLPAASKAALEGPAPREPEGAGAVYEAFLEHVLPYPFGNIHPRGWGWVNGTGTTLAAFAEMLAAAMNPNCWGGEHAASYVEAQVIDWMKDLLGFDAASGVLVSGGSVANVIGVAAARDACTDRPAGQVGMHALPQPLVVYASDQVHNSVDKAASLLGIGVENLRKIATDAEYRIDIGALEQAIAEDRAAGRRPLIVVGTAGTVNTGAIDDLDALADLCAREQMWLHVDGAFGALAALSPTHRSMLRGMERADSLAFDLHKWLCVPIEAGCILVRDADAHRRPFSPPATYLASLERGIASGPHIYSTLGPQLTRGFRALKVWMLIKAHGTDVYARLVEQNIAQAQYVAERIRACDGLALAAPVPLNVVCFRYVARDLDDGSLDALNREVLMQLQERGIAIPSSTVLDGRFVLRVALTNHRTRTADLDTLIDATLGIGHEILDAPAR